MYNVHVSLGYVSFIDLKITEITLPANDFDLIDLSGLSDIICSTPTPKQELLHLQTNIHRSTLTLVTIGLRIICSTQL